MSKCRCDYCRDGRAAREEARHNGYDDGWEETPYVKRRLSNKTCKKSKTGEPCLFTKVIVKWSYYSKSTELYHYTTVKVCERCGKHGPYGYFARPVPFN